MTLHQARHLGQHIHGDAHHRRAPEPEPTVHDGLEAATGIQIHAPDRAVLVPRSTSTLEANTDEKPITSKSFKMPIALGIVLVLMSIADYNN